MRRVAVLGAHGMLGSMLAEVLGNNPELEVVRVARRPTDGAPGFDARTDPPGELLAAIQPDWVLNAMGVLRSRIDETDPGSVAEAFAVNGEFPMRLAAAAGGQRRVIHFGTDAVYAGGGPFAELSRHEPQDVYGRSKDRGETVATQALLLRCSLIGPETTTPPGSLLGWLLSQPPGAVVEGHVNRSWNGLTTWHAAKLCEAIVEGRAGELPSPLHLVPADSVSKAELLGLALSAFGRDDVTVEPIHADPPLNSRLATRHPKSLATLWAAAGYERAPTIAEMLSELARHAPHLKPGS